MNLKKLSAVILSAVMCIGVFSSCKKDGVSGSQHVGSNSLSFKRNLMVEELNGKISVFDSKAEKEAVVGMNLVSGDNINVQKKSHMGMCMDMDKHLFAEENTKFSLIAKGKKDNGKTYIDLEEGQTLISIENELGDDEVFEVNVPNATMTVRGTVFAVDVKKDQTGKYMSILDVLDGEVEVTLTSGKKESVPAGKSLTVVSESDEKFGFLTDTEGNALRDIDFTKFSSDVGNRMANYLTSKYNNSSEEIEIPEPVAINETTFPDENFRKYVKQFDLDADGILSGEEAVAVKKIDISDDPVHTKTPYQNFIGIEYFPELRYLNCTAHAISPMDVSKNLKLEHLTCNYCFLETLDISKNTELKNLHCMSNNLKSLDVTHNKKLEELWVSGNSLQEGLDLSNNIFLKRLHVDNYGLGDVSKNIFLTELDCMGAHVETLDMSNNPFLTSLLCAYSDLTDINITKNPNLKQLWCDGTNIKSIDISNNPELEDFKYDDTVEIIE